MIKSFFEEVKRQQVANPAAITTGTIPASYIDVSGFESFAFVFELGATDNTVDMKVVQATAADGTGSKDVSDAAITQLSGTDDNKQAGVEVDVNQLDINNGFHFVAVTCTIAGTTTGAVVFYGVNPRNAPVSQPAAFAEQVIVAN